MTIKNFLNKSNDANFYDLSGLKYNTELKTLYCQSNNISIYDKDHVNIMDELPNGEIFIEQVKAQVNFDKQEIKFENPAFYANNINYGELWKVICLDQNKRIFRLVYKIDSYGSYYGFRISVSDKITLKQYQEIVFNPNMSWHKELSLNVLSLRIMKNCWGNVEPILSELINNNIIHITQLGDL